VVKKEMKRIYTKTLSCCDEKNYSKDEDPPSSLQKEQLYEKKEKEKKIV
jgi:hypothetical protein